VGSGEKAELEPISVLLAEHEPEVAEMSARYLGRDGLRVRLVTTPEQALAELTSGPDAAAVIDLTMPGLDPRRIRRALRTPVIFLVAGSQGARGEPAGPQPRGLARGGTAGPRRWLARPFGPRQLVAMVRDVLAGSAPEQDADLRIPRVVADGQPVKLTTTELAVLTALLDHPGRVLSRRQLLAAAGRPAAADRAADVYVAQLRAKVQSAVVIRTVRGVGYAIGGSVAEDQGGRATIGGATVPI
jgi:two-component system, OmpR family, response regulator